MPFATVDVHRAVRPEVLPPTAHLRIAFRRAGGRTTAAGGLRVEVADSGRRASGYQTQLTYIVVVSRLFAAVRPRGDSRRIIRSSEYR